ncbi:hypothetical protein [Polaribacter sp.]|uniref:hypothetical protein n=1 Tax=Polaribacter sp. TaxID=1920175 RepID=UPI0025CBA352|nr:hypothetical protein [Polaribacter sp.]
MNVTQQDIQQIASAIYKTGAGGQVTDYMYDLTFKDGRVGEVADYIENNMGDFLSGYDRGSGIGKIIIKIADAVFKLQEENA